MSDHLFLYGTLLPGHEPKEVSDIVHGLEHVGSGQVCGFLYDLGAYPGAILDESASEVVRGEVFKLPQSNSVRELDEYEGFDPHDLEGSLFVRKRAVVLLDDGRRLECWVYVYNRTPLAGSLVPGGDFRRVKAGHRAGRR